MPDNVEDGTCGYPTRDDGPCSNPATESDGSCWLESHGVDAADSESDGRGVGEGNTRAVGNEGGDGPPEGHFRNVENGLSMSVKRRLDWFRHLGEPYISMFKEYYLEYHAKAENQSQAAALASLAMIRDELEEHLHMDGVFYTKQIGDPAEMGEDAFVEMPKAETLEALDRAFKEIRLGMKYEGISGNTGGSSGHQGVNAMWEDDNPEGPVDYVES